MKTLVRSCARRTLTGVVLCLGFGMSSALAAPSDPPSVKVSSTGTSWRVAKQAEVRLISATSAVGSAASVKLGLQIRLQPGWKVYWRTPGDAGVAPRFDWRGSRNFVRARVRWPAPQRFTLYGLETFGYHDQVVLPITATLANPGKPLHVALDFAYGICREVCIPYEARLALDLPAGVARPGRFAPLIAHYAALVPRPGPTPGLAITKAWLARRDGHIFVAVSARAAKSFSNPDLIAEGSEAIGFSRPVAQLGDGGRTAQLWLKTLAGNPPPRVGQRLTFTLFDGGDVIEQTLALSAPP